MKIEIQDVSEGRVDKRRGASTGKKPLLSSSPHSPEIGCVTYGKLPNSSVLYFSKIYNRDKMVHPAVSLQGFVINNV